MHIVRVVTSFVGLRAVVVLSAALLAATACGSSGGADPAFESVRTSETDRDCSVERCITITATVTGNRSGEGFCELYAPGDPEDQEPLARSGSLQMTPGEEVEWVAELPDDAPSLGNLNAVCRPMVEG